MAATPHFATPITTEDHTQGPDSAEVTLVQYGDYECPHTRMSQHSVVALQREYPDSLRSVFRRFPLSKKSICTPAPRQLRPKPHARRALLGHARAPVRAPEGARRRRSPPVRHRPGTDARAIRARPDL